MTDKCAESIYYAYPRHVGKWAAIKAIQKAHARLLKTGMSNQLSEDHLRDAATVYASSGVVAGLDRQFIPYPSTWFNQGRYDDDRAEWGLLKRFEPGVTPNRRGLSMGMTAEQFDSYLDNQLKDWGKIQ